jgi:hypothetical protein
MIYADKSTTNFIFQPNFLVVPRKLFHVRNLSARKALHVCRNVPLVAVWLWVSRKLTPRNNFRGSTKFFPLTGRRHPNLTKRRF